MPVMSVAMMCCRYTRVDKLCLLKVNVKATALCSVDVNVSCQSCFAVASAVDAQQ